MIKLSSEVLDAFGKIIYAVAKADGEVQDSEAEVIRSVIDNDEWAQEVELSFEIERELDQNAEEIFDHAIELFKFQEIGGHYAEFIELLEKIADAHDGIVKEEKEMIDRFKEKLSEHGITQ